MATDAVAEMQRVYQAVRQLATGSACPAGVTAEQVASSTGLVLDTVMWVFDMQAARWVLILVGHADPAQVTATPVAGPASRQ